MEIVLICLGIWFLVSIPAALFMGRFIEAGKGQRYIQVGPDSIRYIE